MNQQAERRVGTIIGGKWRVDALLGSGSMAAVYAVTHRNGARAALKILHPTLCVDPAVCERFLGEGYLANSVKHEGVVRVSDDGLTDDGCVFLVMDLLEGDTLEALRERRGGRIPVSEALELADDLMDVLSAVHSAGIIHRDLKPQNVFVCHDGTVKLLDFGVARVSDRAAQSKLSMFGLVLGTPSFMSPEQALGSRDKVDHRSDIWSLGATLFTALTGETVHLGANMQAKLLAAATVKARPIAMVMPELPGGVSSAIDMALRFKKEDRWQSVDAMRRALRDARLQVAPQASVPPPGFDLSLDEPTHVDKGKPKFADTMRSHGEPNDADPTLVGMGLSDLAAMPATQAHPGAPARPPMRSVPPPLGPSLTPPPFGTVPPPSPGGVLRRAPSVADFRSSRPDGQEGSLPAFGGSVPAAADESAALGRSLAPRRKSSPGLWIAAVLVVSAGLGGLAAFAVKGGASAGSTSPLGSSATTSALATPPAPTLLLPSTAVTVPTTAPSPAAPAIPTLTVIELPDEPAAADAGALASAAAAAPPPPPRRRTPRAAPRASAAGDGPQPDGPRPPPELPPDPFGTPE